MATKKPVYRTLNCEQGRHEACDSLRLCKCDCHDRGAGKAAMVPNPKVPSLSAEATPT